MTAHDDPDLDPTAFARLKRLGGDSLLRRMLESFLTHAPARVEAALKAGSEGDLAALSESTHSLKSSAANVGAVTIQNLAQQLEQLARDGNAVAIPPLLDELREAFARTRAKLEEERKGLSA